MLNKKFFVIFSLFIVLCCFSVVSASEDSTNDSNIVSDEGNVNEVVYGLILGMNQS